MLLRMWRATSDRGRPVLVVLSIAALAMSWIAGGAAGSLLALASVILIASAASRLLTNGDRTPLVSWVAGATLARIVAAAVLHVVLLRRGPEGALFLDDAGYVQIAIALADHWHGQGLAPFVDPSLDHNYVRLAGILFYILGPNVFALKLLNTTFAVLAALLVYRTMVAAELPGRRFALGLMLAFPSIVLWSMLALKDSYTLFFSLLATWGVVEFARTRRYMPWYLVITAALLAIENVRAFLFVILVAAWPIALVPSLRDRRTAPVSIAVAIAIVLLATTSALNYLNPNIVTASIYVRQAMAQRASSGFVAPLPVIQAEPCVLFVVTVAGRTPVAEPRQHDVRAGTELVVDRPGRTAEPGRLLVRPGDVVAVAGATPCPVAIIATPPPTPAGPPPTPAPGATGPTPTPTPSPTPIPTLPPVVLAAEGRNVVSTPAPQFQDAFAFSRDLLATAAHLPIGIAALLFAPFPLFARGPSEIAAAPEMLVWYATLALALLGVRRLKPAARARFSYGLLVLGVVALVLSLYEGNLGTLVRHRSMVIPFVVVLAAVGGSALRGGRTRRS